MRGFVIWALVLSAPGAVGCLVRAPTTYELDQRAGNAIPPAEPTYEHPKRHRRASFDEPLRSTSGIAPTPLMPARTTPVIRRVWVADQTLPDGSWLQGTWWYLEVEPSRWLHEVDPGAAPFAEPALPPAPVAPERKKGKKSGSSAPPERSAEPRRRGAEAPEPGAGSLLGEE